jgi:aldose 1-epimerase
MPGTEHTLASGHYTAVVTARGGALRELRHKGRDLVVGFDADGPIPDYRGVICAPWPNRLADGTYTYGGRTFEAGINEPERRSALHGLATGRLWEVQHAAGDEVVMGCRITPGTGYPGELDLSVTYRLTADGLLSTVRAANAGPVTAPYGVCPHPYLVAGPSGLDEWSLELPASEFLEVTEDRLLPVGMRSVDRHEFDFRSPRRLGPVKIDHAFTGIARGSDGRARVRVQDPGGTGVELEWGAEWPWVQIHTADKPIGPDRLGLAVEPMTCPPDAFNSGADLVHLQPGRTHTAQWTIRALG